MSLILEALRRADAERQRGAVPGLHAQTGMALPSHGGTGLQAASGQRWLLLGAVGAGLRGGLGAWAWVRISTPAPLPAAAGLPLAAPAALPVSATPAATPAATPVPAPTAPPPSVLAAAPGAALPQPAAVPPPPAAALPSVPMPRPAAAAPLSRAAAPQRAAPAALQRLPSLAELPDATRRELPAMTLGGSMYAEQPALRMVIINGQVVHEGDRLAPELLVQQIRQKSVVLNWRGQAFELGL